MLQSSQENIGSETIVDVKDKISKAFVGLFGLKEYFNDIRYWKRLHEKYQNDSLDEREWVSGRVEDIENLFRSERPDLPFETVMAEARERANIEWLCQSLTVLPREGMSAAELQGLGFKAKLDDYYTDSALETMDTLPYYNDVPEFLRLVGFPKGWRMVPATGESDITSLLGSNDSARVLDANGEPQMSVFYRANQYTDPSEHSYCLPIK